MIECPDCDTTADEYHEMFTHRVKKHTDSGDGDSFNLYDEEVFTIFQELAVVEATERAKDSPDEDVTVEDLKRELKNMGVHVGLDENIQEFSEEVEI